MGIRGNLHAIRTRLRDDQGAESVEFALVGPIVLFLAIGIIYALMALAAQLSLSHAAGVGVRYASLPTDPVDGVYPTTEEVAAEIHDSSVFFAAESCTTSVVGDETQNAPVTLDVTCEFPNPMGIAVNAMRSWMLRSDDPGPYSDSIQMSAHAKARRE